MSQRTHIWSCGHRRKYAAKDNRRIKHVELCPACHGLAARDVRAYMDLMADVAVRHGRR